MNTNWRDCKSWLDIGLGMNTTSNEASKLFDATLSQYVTLYQNPGMGGIRKTIQEMLSADPNFVMGHVLVNGFELMTSAKNPKLDPEFKSRLDTLASLAGGQYDQLSKRESKHAKAVQLYGEGYLTEACSVWEEILIDHPTDMLAIRFLYFAYVYTGLEPEVRDCMARVLPHWKEDTPLYTSLLGMYSFGLVETNFYDKAEKVARKALEMEHTESSSIHSLAHVFEMMGRYDEGITFMNSTVQEWEKTRSSLLFGHISWHWALYHIEKGDYEETLNIYDNTLHDRIQSMRGILDIVDTTSLLYRLQLEGVDVKSRWNDVFEVCKPHYDDHLMAFNDIHFLMASIGAQEKDTTQAMMNSIKDFIHNGSGTNHQVTKEVGAAICEAFIAYDEGNFAKATELIIPIRYKIVKIGRSNAQRDLMNQFLIHTAMKSPNLEHNKLARNLIAERKALNENSPLTDRLMSKFLACHI